MSVKKGVCKRGPKNAHPPYYKPLSPHAFVRSGKSNAEINFDCIQFTKYQLSELKWKPLDGLRKYNMLSRSSQSGLLRFSALYFSSISNVSIRSTNRRLPM